MELQVLASETESPTGGGAVSNVNAIVRVAE